MRGEVNQERQRIPRRQLKADDLPVVADERDHEVLSPRHGGAEEKSPVRVRARAHAAPRQEDDRLLERLPRKLIHDPAGNDASLRLERIRRREGNQKREECKEN